MHDLGGMLANQRMTPRRDDHYVLYWLYMHRTGFLINPLGSAGLGRLRKGQKSDQAYHYDEGYLQTINFAKNPCYAELLHLYLSDGFSN